MSSSSEASLAALSQVTHAQTHHFLTSLYASCLTVWYITPVLGSRAPVSSCWYLPSFWSRLGGRILFSVWEEEEEKPKYPPLNSCAPLLSATTFHNLTWSCSSWRWASHRYWTDLFSFTESAVNASGTVFSAWDRGVVVSYYSQFWDFSSNTEMISSFNVT